MQRGRDPASFDAMPLAAKHNRPSGHANSHTCMHATSRLIARTEASLTVNSKRELALLIVLWKARLALLEKRAAAEEVVLALIDAVINARRPRRICVYVCVRGCGCGKKPVGCVVGRMHTQYTKPERLPSLCSLASRVRGRI